MKTIKIAISDEAYGRLQNYPDKPRQQWGKRNTPEFYGNVLQMAMDSDSFRLREAQAQIQHLESVVRWRERENQKLQVKLKLATSK